MKYLFCLLSFISSCSPPINSKIAWASKAPLTLYIHSSFPNEAVPVLYRAIQVWEQGANKKLFDVSYSQDSVLYPRQDKLNTIYWLHSWNANKPREQGKTTLYIDRGTILEADISINGTHTFYIDMPVNATDIHLESLLIHELGHMLGLNHNGDEASVMHTYLPANKERIILTDTDKECLNDAQ